MEGKKLWLIIWMVLFAMCSVGCSANSIVKSLIDSELSGPINGEIKKQYQLDGMQVKLDISLDDEMLVDYTTHTITFFPSNSQISVVTVSDAGFQRDLTLFSGSAEGKLTYRYMENGVERDFSDYGRTWWEQILPSIFRETGYDYRQRIRQIVEKSGTSAALSDTNQVVSDMVCSLYLRELVNHYSLTDKEYETTLLISENIKSDSNHADFLSAFVRSDAFSEHLTFLLKTATDNIQSSYELARVLEQVIRSPKINKEEKKNVLNAAAFISSKSEKQRILRLLSAVQDDND
ncbi:hypothetical protein [Arsukibacterium sp. MJ3]|uniref:hypothetical protein n=1 Tax=Arsukibacterium sp. MJ3 TaxID=1632859 RepID=UPI00128B2836|nr:hypothetical protein [Arsukibacterium sp. MJ3]